MARWDASGTAWSGNSSNTSADPAASSAPSATAVQGSPIDIGGYYLPDDAKANTAFRPSETLNAILASA